MNKKVKTRQWFLNRDPNFGRKGKTVEFIPGRAVTVIDGFCCAVKKNEKLALHHEGYKKVMAKEVPRKTRDKLIKVMKV